MSQQHDAALDAFIASKTRFDQLIELGNLSAIEDQPIAYHRDKGEAWQPNKPEQFTGIEMLQCRPYQTDFTYLWIDGWWQTLNR